MSIFDRKRAGEEEEDSGKSVEAKFAALETKLAEDNKKLTETLGSLSETIRAQNERWAAEEEARKKVAKEAEKPVAKTAEEELEAFAADPKKYIQAASSGGAQVALITHAKLLRQEILGDKEYYYGDIKTKVDAMLSAESVSNQNNPAIVHNCYKVVVADHMQEIMEGKLKARASMSSGADAGIQGGRKTGSGDTVTVDYRTAKDKAAAAAFGLEDKDFIEGAKEGVHGLEVVY